MASDNGESSFRLQDRTAILTGSSNSIVQAIAFKLTQMGVNLVMIDRNTDKLARFAAQLMDAREVHERYGRAIAVQADLTKANQAQDAISKAAESFGGLDLYIDAMMTTEVKPFKDPAALADFDQMIETNLRAAILTTHAAIRFLEGRKRGRVIYLMHDLARMGMVNNSLMAVTRTGLTAFARSLSREVADKNITVNCVAAGITEDILLAQNGTESLSIQEAQGRLAKAFPQATMTEPEKIANLVAFLASPLGAGITGQTIAVSQGLSFLS